MYMDILDKAISRNQVCTWLKGSYVHIVTHVCNGDFALIIGYQIGATGIIFHTSYAPQLGLEFLHAYTVAIICSCILSTMKGKLQFKQSHDHYMMQNTTCCFHPVTGFVHNFIGTKHKLRR